MSNHCTPTPVIGVLLSEREVRPSLYCKSEERLCIACSAVKLCKDISQKLTQIKSSQHALTCVLRPLLPINPELQGNLPFHYNHPTHSNKLPTRAICCLEAYNLFHSSSEEFSDTTIPVIGMSITSGRIYHFYFSNHRGWRW